MHSSIRRLGPGDEKILGRLAADDADFDLEGRGSSLPPLGADIARRYLANLSVLHWVAVSEGEVTGFLYCILLPLRSGDGQEMRLYEIGVRSA